MQRAWGKVALLPKLSPLAIKSFDFDVVPWFPTEFELCEQCVAIHERGDCECSEGA